MINSALVLGNYYMVMCDRSVASLVPLVYGVPKAACCALESSPAATKNAVGSNAVLELQGL